MHTAAKVTLGIGAVLTVLGIIGGIVGGATIADSLGPIEEETLIDSASSGQFTIENNESWSYSVIATESYTCSQIDEISLMDQNSYESFESWGWCWDGEEAIGDDLGYIVFNSGDTFDLTSPIDVKITGTYQQVDEEDALGGVFAIMGSFGAACCGILVLIVGIIMWLTMDGGNQHAQQQVGFVQAPVGGMQQSNVVGTMVTGAQNYNQMPAQAMGGQQMMGQPMQGVPQTQPVQTDQGYSMGTVGAAAAVATTPIVAPVVAAANPVVAPVTQPQTTQMPATNPAPAQNAATNQFMPPLTDSATPVQPGNQVGAQSQGSFWQQPPQGGV